MKLTKNFYLTEFACHDGTAVPKKYYSNVQLLADNLQVLRDFIGEPIRILSGYRTASWNKKVEGKDKSQHLKAKAADIVSRNYTPQHMKNVIETLITDGKMKQGGLGLYPGFVHYDVRDKKARWP